MSPAKRKCIFALGMLAGETSFLSHTLSLLGPNQPVSIQPEIPANRKGYFESHKVALFHDELLTSIPRRWDSFAPIPNDWYDSESTFKAVERLGEIFIEDYPGDAPVVLKDPWISMLIPLWSRVADRLNLDDYYVISLSHPRKVQASLQKRNPVTDNVSNLIFLNYYLNAELRTRDRKRSVVCFPPGLGQAAATIERIQKDLGFEFPRSENFNIEEMKNEFELNLVPNKLNFDDNKLTYLESLSRQLYESIGSLCDSPFDGATIREIDLLRNDFSLMAEVCSQVTLNVDQERQLLEMEKRYGELNRKIAEKDKILAESERMIAEHAEQMAERNKLIATQREQIAMYREQLDNYTKTASANDDVLKRLTCEYEDLVARFNCEKYTVIRPILRNLYRLSGGLARKLLSPDLILTLKKYLPNPDGIPHQLAFQPCMPLQKNVDIEQLSRAVAGSKPDVFILSIINWNFRYQRPQHIAKGLAEYGRRVFYIEMEPSQNELIIDNVDVNVYCVKLPGAGIGTITAYNGQHDEATIRNWIKVFYDFCDAANSTPYKQVIIQHPFWWQFCRHFSAEFEIIYDCMDDISGFSNTTPQVVSLENDLMDHCGKCVVTSQYLYDKYKKNRTPILIRNAADLDHFNLGRINSATGGGFKLKNNNTAAGVIRIGYVGAIAEWFDSQLIREIAELKPEFNIHICGAVSAKEAIHLKDIKNVQMYGEITYSQVPYFLHQMDVMLIPFKIVPIILACDPVKFYEYCAMAKPVVATDLPELERASHLVFKATDAREFIAQITEAYNSGRDKKYQEMALDYARENSWQDRVNQFDLVLNDIPEVAVVLQSTHDVQLVRKSLNSLLKPTPSYPNLRVFIKGEGLSRSDRDEIKQIKSHYSHVDFLPGQPDESIPANKGHRLGSCSAEYVLWLNAGDMAAPGSLYAMVNQLLKNPELGAVAPMNGLSGNSCYAASDPIGLDDFKQYVRRTANGHRGRYASVDAEGFPAFMCRKSDLKRLGLISEDAGAGAPPVDRICAALKSNGYLCGQAKDAFYRPHPVDVSTARTR